jgi:hypothetical protein
MGPEERSARSRTAREGAAAGTIFAHSGDGQDGSPLAMACRQGLGDAEATNPWRLWVQDESFGASRAGLAVSPSALSLLRVFRLGGLFVGGSFPTAV